MALATRCPHCLTIFRVANDQLKLHAGLVRCGSCQQTFNGVEHLVPPHELTKPVQPKPDVATNSATAQAQPQVQSQAQQAEISAEIPAEKMTIRPESVVTSGPVEIIINEAALEKAAFPPAAKTPVAQAVVDDIEIREKTNELPEDLESVLAATTTRIPEEPVVPSPAPTPVPAPTPAPESSASLDFFFGEDDPFAEIAATPPETVSAQIQLEAKAAMLEEPSIDWSVADEVSTTGAGQISEPDADEPEESLPTTIVVDTIQEPYLPDTTDDVAIAETEAALEQLATAAEDSVSDTGTGVSEDDKPEFVLQAEKAEKRGRLYSIVMILLSLILLPALIAQSGYVFRNQIAAAYPETRAVLEQACRILHCQISLPAQIDYITIESNELQTLSPEKNTFSLVMQLQNRSNTVQSWPMVELVLNDAKDKPVLQKAFAPKDYLSEPTEIAKGFSPVSEKNITLYFELPKLKASGYHVRAFYP